VEKQQDAISSESKKNGDSYPPGMVSPEGGESPHFHLVGTNLTSLW